ncbi:IclR family transcriptional regulator [Synergistales bacterium]|nr:IclR family transcriptional regulator [Synergistales bacterium]
MAKDNHSAVNRVADILEYVAVHKEGATFSDVTRDLAIPKSSLHPLIHTLCKRQFVHFKENEQRYFLGNRIFYLAIEYGGNASSLNMINDVLLDLAQSVGETCYFGVLSGNEILYLLKQVANSIQVTARPGYRLKAYASAIGKALLSQFDKDELLLLYPDGLEPITKNTIVDVDKLYQQLSEARDDGFFYEKEESSAHVQCIATPIFYQKKIMAALSIAFPVFNDTQNPQKLQINKENLVLARRRIEEIIARNREDWV